ncbi:hypothetical protein GM51_15540 [freshwater metagenome]|uniref:Uncharacterized protein n=1 Tax=freshwater metagenome TaxID=449393 RepID=A0A094PVH9_9ZZZZ
MRQIHERVLVAKGYYLGKPISAPRLRVYLAQDQLGSEFLFIRGRILGPSWPTIAKVFDESQIEYSLIEVGSIWLVAPDLERVRQLLLGLTKLAKQSVSEEVHVPEVGFVSAGIKKRFELLTLLGPVLIALLSMGLFLVPAMVPEQESLEQSKPAEISCALDLSAGELRDWVAASLEGRGPTSSAEVLVQSELGTLTLEIQQTLGSTQSVTGQIDCEDGRSKRLHYRLDASANGNLVEIGQELNP